VHVCDCAPVCHCRVLRARAAPSFVASHIAHMLHFFSRHRACCVVLVPCACLSIPLRSLLRLCASAAGCVCVLMAARVQCVRDVCVARLRVLFSMLFAACYSCTAARSCCCMCSLLLVSVLSPTVLHDRTRTRWWAWMRRGAHGVVTAIVCASFWMVRVFRLLCSFLRHCTT